MRCSRFGRQDLGYKRGRAIASEGGVMELYLVRHGQAAAKVDEPGRPLTEPGAEVVEQVAVFAARAGIRVDEVRHSEKLRAKQTAEILAQSLQPPRGVNAVVGLNPEDDVHAMAETLEREDGCLMLVGHLPHLATLAALKVGDRVLCEPFHYEGKDHLTVVEGLEKGFEVVLFDTPPVLSVVDSLILSAQVESVILVVQPEKTTKKPLMRAVEMLERVNAKILGVVFNQAKIRQRDYYYMDYYYSYRKDYTERGEHR